MRTIAIGLKQVARGAESACAADSKAEAGYGIRRIAASERYVEIAEPVHLTAAWGETVDTHHVGNIQTSGGANDIESKNTIVPVARTECCEARVHSDADVDVTSV